jgi:superfamily II DNA helicase RecQ
METEKTKVHEEWFDDFQLEHSQLWKRFHTIMEYINNGMANNETSPELFAMMQEKMTIIDRMNEIQNNYVYRYYQTHKERERTVNEQFPEFEVPTYEYGDEKETPPPLPLFSLSYESGMPTTNGSRPKNTIMPCDQYENHGPDQPYRNFDDPAIFQCLYQEKTITLEIILKGNTKTVRYNQILNWIQKNCYTYSSGIIFCLTKAEVQSLTMFLQEKSLKACAICFNTNPKYETKYRKKWEHDKIKIIVTTIAFNLNISKPNIRFVIHNGVARSLEHYVNEIFLAGNDLAESKALMLYTYTDDLFFVSRIISFEFNEHMNKNRQINEKDMHQPMAEYARNNTECRLKMLLQHFNHDFENLDPDFKCNRCDICVTEERSIMIIDVTNHALNILQLIVAITQARSGPPYLTPQYITNVYCGSKTKTIIGSGDLNIPQAGNGSTITGVKSTFIEKILIELMNKSLLQVTTLSNKFHHFNAIIPNELTLSFIADPQQVFIKERNEQAILLIDEHEEKKDIILQILNNFRVKTAIELQIDPELLISIAILHIINHDKIIDQNQFLRIPGTSIQMWNDIGNEIISVFNQICDCSNIQLHEFFQENCQENEEESQPCEDDLLNDEFDEDSNLKSKFQFFKFVPPVLTLTENTRNLYFMDKEYGLVIRSENQICEEVILAPEILQCNSFLTNQRLLIPFSELINIEICQSRPVILDYKYTRKELYHVLDHLFSSDCNPYIIAFNSGIINPGIVVSCCQCGKIISLFLRDFCFRCTKCHIETNLAGFFFQSQHHISLNQIFRILLCWAMNFTVEVTSTLMKVSDKTIIGYFKIFRKRAALIIEAEARLRQFTDSVQIDESLFAKRKYNRGRIIPQKWVFGVCAGTKQGRVYMKYVPDRTKKTLIAQIQKLVNINAIVNSDAWASYKQLKKLGFDHRTVNHSINFVDPQTGAHTQRVESLWGVCKKWCKKQNYHHSEYLQDYLYEWCFKYNCHGDLKIIISSLFQYKINMA